MASFIPFSTATLITLLAGFAAFLMVYAVWNAALVRDPMRGRVKSLQARREALKSGYTTARKRPHKMRHVKSVGMMRQVVKNLNLSRREKTAKLTDQLEMAGWRTKDALVILLFFKLVLPIVLGTLAVILIYGLDMFHMSPLMKVMSAFGVVGTAAMAPGIFINNQISKRRAAIQKALPDALDLLVICAEAGLTLDAALMRVGRENAKSFPELADEFSLTAIELGFLPNRREALINLNRRVASPSVRAVTATLIQAEKYGTPLANSLRVLSSEFRNERMMKAEEKAAKLPVVMTIPLILFIMPTLFIVLLGPAACKVADEFVHPK